MKREYHAPEAEYIGFQLVDEISTIDTGSLTQGGGEPGGELEP